MIFRYTAYSPTKRYVSPLDVKKALPAPLAEALLSQDSFSYGIFVDSSREDVVQALDKRFRIGRKRDFTKHQIVEVSRNELDLYEYYRILPRELDPDVQVSADHNITDLDGFLCTIRMTKDLAGPYSIATLWSMLPYVILIISAPLKKQFDDAGIDGLKYHEITQISKQMSQSPASRGYYAAIFEATSSCEADGIVLDADYDKKTNVVSAPHVFGLRYPRHRLKDVGFQSIRDIHVGKKTYFYATPGVFVSRQVVRLLLDLRTKGLFVVAHTLKEKFMPVLITETST